MEKKIWNIIGLIIIAILSLGIAVPNLVSAKSDIAVTTGVALGIITVYLLVKQLIKLFK